MVPRQIAVILVLVTALAAGGGCDRSPGGPPAGGVKKVRLAVTTWPASAAVLVAQEKGYFPDAGLEAEIATNSSGHLGLAAVLAGQADLATVGETPIARAAVEGKALAIIATLCRIDRAILIIARKDRGIAGAEDLKGKRVGVVPGTTAEFYLHIYLTTSYVKPADVTIVELAPEQVLDAVSGGTVDAVSTWAPYTTAARERLGGNAVVLHEPGLYTMSWNVVAARELSGRDPELATRFLRAVERANRLIAEHPGEARAITARSTGMTPAALEQEWGDYTMTAMLDQSLILYLDDQARWLRAKQGGAGKAPNFLEYVAPAGLKAVRPDAVRIALPRE